MGKFLTLTKPGIIMGNLITAAAGFAFASKGHFNGILFLIMVVGLGCVIGASCVCNNYIDKDLDKMMMRTKKRALAMGTISGKGALLFAFFLAAVGMTLFSLFTNFLATSLAALGFCIYVGLYSYGKSRTPYATLIGSVAGALPPVIGYAVVSNRLDAGAAFLFLILVFWQMPHFFAIAMFRLDDYTAAKIPVLPVERGNAVTKVRMLLYTIAFLIATVFLTTGITYLLVVVPLGIAWILLACKGFKASDDQLWARQMFSHSLVAITALSVMITIDSFL